MIRVEVDLLIKRGMDLLSDIETLKPWDIEGAQSVINRLEQLDITDFAILAEDAGYVATEDGEEYLYTEEPGVHESFLEVNRRMLDDNMEEIVKELREYIHRLEIVKNGL